VLRSTIFRGRKKEDVKRFVAEIEILKRLKHDHIVKFVGSYTDALIMTPIADGDLAIYMVEATSAKFPELRTFFGCLATAIDYLHSQGIRHKDIKPTNILVSNGTVLLADFGLSLDYADASGSTTMGIAYGMTPRYCVPEIAKHESRNTKSDIWCLGVVFLEMIVTLKGTKMQYMDHFFKQHGTRDVFIHLNTVALPEFIVHVAALGQSIDNTPLEWTERMLLVSQVDRPTASELATHIMTRGMKERNIRFCGICCITAEEEEFSDYSIE
jgi:serine/threonine protein kinase